MKMEHLSPICHPRHLSSGIQGFCFFFVREENDTGFPYIAWIPDQVRDKRRE